MRHPDPDLIVRDNAYWLYFVVWNSDYIVVDLTTELSEKYTTVEEMKKVYNSEVVLTLDELPKFIRFWQLTSKYFKPLPDERKLNEQGRAFEEIVVENILVLRHKICCL